MLLCLEGLEPDVIALQEVKPDHMIPIKRIMGGKWEQYTGGSTNGGEHRVLFVRNELVSEVEEWDLITAAYKGREIHTGVAVKVNGVYIINVHFDYARDKMRRAQFEKVSDYVKNLPDFK